MAILNDKMLWVARGQKHRMIFIIELQPETEHPKQSTHNPKTWLHHLAIGLKDIKTFAAILSGG